jgi:hypothetical protein
MNVQHALHQLRRAPHQRLAVHSHGRVSGQRLDEQRHAQIAARLEVMGGREYGEVRGGDLVEREQLLRQRLVLPDEHLAWPAARVGDVHQVEQTVHRRRTEGEVLAEVLQQIEGQVGLLLVEPAQQLAHVIVNAEHRRLVSARTQGARDLFHHCVVGTLVRWGLEIGQDRDLHSRSCMPD